jgi:hypothetical protein
VVVDDDANVLHFYSPPYLFILAFPVAVVEKEEDTAKYDPIRQGGMITITRWRNERLLGGLIWIWWPV